MARALHFSPAGIGCVSLEVAGRPALRQRRRPRRVSLALAAMIALTGVAVPAAAQTPGESVNMVSGTTFPGGDPFLQRQNEPSVAISSRNNLHLLAGANDYRTVDLPFADALPGTLSGGGDAWLGLFKSFDGGKTWQSTLLPGFPQDTSPEGAGSPLRAYESAADPTVRAGTHGLFYYSGIAYNRSTNEGAVFLSRFIDLNNKENGDVTASRDPIRYIDTVLVDLGGEGQFVDKPWIAVDVARRGAETCSIVVPPGPGNPGATQTMPGGIVYLAWSRFTGTVSSAIMVSRSRDCGRTWERPVRVSVGETLNQGASIAIDPRTGDVHVVWRQFADATHGHAIMAVTSRTFGRSFAAPAQVAAITPFDQGTTSGSFRTNSLPTSAVAVDVTGASRLHVAWAERVLPFGDARIVVTTSSNGLHWGPKTLVDGGAILDESSPPLAFSRGHQIMPQLTFAAGQLLVLYYDLRLDHTIGIFTPNSPFVPFPDTGRFYRERREPVGELLTNPPVVYAPFITDIFLTQRRHTLDLRLSRLDPATGAGGASTLVSLSRFGLWQDDTGQISNRLEQLDFNPPNLPLFQQGTVPFFGDYIDIGGESFLPPEASGDDWRFNIAAQPAPVFYAVWTSNQDVRPPKDGNWQNYTPVGTGGTSIFDPNQPRPMCVTGQEGMRNQNVYSSRITNGLGVSSPQNAKPLSSTLERALAVIVENRTEQTRAFRLSIASQPVGGRASFTSSASAASCPAPPSLPPPAGDPSRCTALDVEIGARSSIARSVFATSSDALARIVVDVAEIDTPGGTPIAQGLSGFVVFNGDRSVAPLTNPDNAIGDVTLAEQYDPFVSGSLVTDPNINVANANVSNANIANINVANINIANANIANANVANINVANINVANANIANANIANANIANANVANINVANQPIADATWAITNQGNTSHTYHVKMAGQAPSIGTRLQLFISKPYLIPTAVDCELKQELQPSTLANIGPPQIVSLGAAFDPNIPDERISNATVALAPGQSVLLTLRGNITVPDMQQVAARLTPVVVPHAGGSAPIAISLIVTSDTASLPGGKVGVPYATTLQAIGGTPPYAWSVDSGSLPPGLTLDAASGVVSGTPLAAGSFTAAVKVTDASAVQQSNLQTLTFAVSARATATAIAVSPNPTVVGQPTVATLTVTDIDDPATRSAPAGDVSLVGAFTGSCTLAPLSADSARCTVSIVPLAQGTVSVGAAYAGSAAHAASAAAAIRVEVNKVRTRTIVAERPDPSIVGQPVLVTVTVEPLGVTGIVPTGTVVLSVKGDLLCTIRLSGGAGSCTWRPRNPAATPLDAVYSGDSVFAGSTAFEPHTLNRRR